MGVVEGIGRNSKLKPLPLRQLLTDARVENSIDRKVGVAKVGVRRRESDPWRTPPLDRALG